MPPCPSGTRAGSSASPASPSRCTGSTSRRRAVAPLGGAGPRPRLRGGRRPRLCAVRPAGRPAARDDELRPPFRGGRPHRADADLAPGRDRGAGADPRPIGRPAPGAPERAGRGARAHGDDPVRHRQRPARRRPPRHRDPGQPEPPPQPGPARPAGTPLRGGHPSPRCRPRAGGRPPYRAPAVPGGAHPPPPARLLASSRPVPRAGRACRTAPCSRSRT